MADNGDFFNINNFTPRAKRVLFLAQQEAKRLNHDYIGTEHILLGLIAVNEGVAIEALKSMNLNLSKLRLEVEKAVGTGGETKIEGNLPISSGVNELLNNAVLEAQSMNYNFVGTEHILLALLQMTDSVSARILNNMKIDIKKLKKKIFSMLDSDYIPFSDEENDDDFPPSEAKNGELNALNSFGRNLTELAAAGKLDPVIGRQDEIARVIQILCRRTKK